MEKLRYDLYYIKHLSMFFDLTIVFDTVKVVLFRKGAAVTDRRTERRRPGRRIPAASSRPSRATSRTRYLAIAAETLHRPGDAAVQPARTSGRRSTACGCCSDR